MTDTVQVQAMRIARFLEQEGVSFLENERRTGISRMRLKRLIDGTTNKPFSETELSNLQGVYGLSKQWILTGLLPMQGAENKQTEQPSAIEQLRLIVDMDQDLRRRLEDLRPGIIEALLAEVWPAVDLNQRSDSNQD